MKICHVVTLLSADGSFGGPARVALSQASGLSARGHDVVILAAGDGLWKSSNRDLDVRTLPMIRWTHRLGFGGLASPAVWRATHRLAQETDIFHFHLGRDGVTLPASLVAKRSRVPYVLQCHGMVMPDRRAIVEATDAIATRRVLKSAARILYLTDVEREGLIRVRGGESDLRLKRVVNGIDVHSPNGHDGASQAQRSGILFCSRLHPRKRVVAFAEMFRMLRDRGSQEEAFVVGPDEGDLSALHEAIDTLGLNGLLHYEGSLPHSKVLERVRRARVLVLPSDDEPFPMISLEAMSVGTPVVVTTSCHIADELAEAGAALVSDRSAESLAESVLTLLSNRSRAEAITDHAKELISTRYSLTVVVDALESVYTDAVSGLPH